MVAWPHQHSKTRRPAGRGIHGARRPCVVAEQRRRDNSMALLDEASAIAGANDAELILPSVSEARSVDAYRPGMAATDVCRL